MAIERLLTHSLTLRAQFMEIPQAQADVLSAGLRANPIFYADSQLVPYGQYNRSRPGGQTQYDVNVSYPLDISRKRQARTLVATRATRVLEAQYQDAVRTQIDSLYTSYVDVLAARQTAIYARTSFETYQRIMKDTMSLYQKAEESRANVNRVRIEQEAGYLAMLDSEETLKQKKRALGAILNIPPTEAERMELYGTIADRALPPPAEVELVQLALALRPDVVSYRLGVHRAEADVKLALANRLNDVYVLYQPYTLQNNAPFGLKSPTSWALGVTVPLPIYNRNQGGILRAKLNVTQSQIELQTLERQVITEVQIALHEYDITRRAVERIEKQILPAAEVVKSDWEKMRRAGELTSVEYLYHEKEYNDTVKTYHDTLVRHRLSMLRLNTAVAQRILP
jgi:cobalt-zinc-cadmium efflux system outer membrane protein